MAKLSSDIQGDPHFSVAEVARLYRVCGRTVRTWVAGGKMRALKIGRLIRIPASALREFDEKH